MITPTLQQTAEHYARLNGVDFDADRDWQTQLGSIRRNEVYLLWRRIQRNCESSSNVITVDFREGAKT